MSAPAARILVIDDEAGIRSLLRDVFHDLGYETVAAEDGEEAVRQLRAHPDVRLAIVDLSLPGKGGLEVLADLRAVRPGLPAIVSTGYAESLASGAGAAALEGARRAGTVELLAKPYRIDRLAEMVERLLA